MPTTHITVTAVTDEGDTVNVWGQPDNTPDDAEPVGYVFSTKGNRDSVALAERASRLAVGTEAVIEYTPVVDGWSVARGLSFP